jgi:YHS domain-containing protein
MKSIFTIMFAVIIALAVAAPTALYAEEKIETEKKAEIPEGFNAQTTCPVMGGKITSTSFIDYQGQRVYFCCPGCEGSFLADPEKYFEAAAKDKILFENVQTTCPVMGNPVDKQFFTYYKGRGIYFCCASCIETFNADPEKYLEKMGEVEEKGKKKGHEGHEGHEGHDKDHEGHGHDDHDHEGHDHDKDHDHDNGH